ncbi:hypothetical protein F2P81_001265 [Scophthalmus maximus]|uniref:Uncharacterized protein n=1 Tax=Scophthalmus maximus TaxID=52904 RepID=A0A6A4U007_SCOMX|nr:hypothetical protein F2P81_001265 [Scophthalmus maximus]
MPSRFLVAVKRKVPVYRLDKRIQRVDQRSPEEKLQRATTVGQCHLTSAALLFSLIQRNPNSSQGQQHSMQLQGPATKTTTVNIMLKKKPFPHQCLECIHERNHKRGKEEKKRRMRDDKDTGAREAKATSSQYHSFSSMSRMPVITTSSSSKQQIVNVIHYIIEGRYQSMVQKSETTFPITVDVSVAPLLDF